MAARDDIASFFDANASLYDPWFRADTHYKELLGEIIDRLAPRAPRRLVELGCGTGNLSALLAERFPDASIVAVDVSHDSLIAAREKCARYLNIRFHEGDMLEAVADAAPGSVFVANYSLHHLVEPEKEALCVRVSERSGSLVIGDVFHAAPVGAEELQRAKAILDLIHARAHYYLDVVGLDRCVFEVEHLPLLLNDDREHVVERGFWSRVGSDHGLAALADEAVGPPELGNYIVELQSRGA
jgi:ubiquinone/menaquinone biosynthesis C-methylase UbiE